MKPLENSVKPLTLSQMRFHFRKFNGILVEMMFHNLKLFFSVCFFVGKVSFHMFLISKCVDSGDINSKSFFFVFK